MRPFWELAANGKGCHHCEVGIPVDHIESRRGKVLALCLECVMLWFPDSTIEWWEARHGLFLDYVNLALKRSSQKELAKNMEALAREHQGRVGAVTHWGERGNWRT